MAAANAFSAARAKVPCDINRLLGILSHASEGPLLPRSGDREVKCRRGSSNPHMRASSPV